MRKTMITIAASLALVAGAASAQNASPIGKWKTLDDKTGKPMTITEIYQAKNGTLAAKIVENLGLPATCDKCSGEYKGKPTVGIVTLWNLKEKKPGVWGDGNGYKPSEDRKFKAKSVELSDGGNKLKVTGCVAIFCRTGEWERVH